MKKLLLKSLVLILLMTAAALAAGDPEYLDWPEPAGFPPYVLSGSEGRLAGPPEFVHAGRTGAIAWNSAGRYLSLLTQPVTPQPLLDAPPPPPAPSELSVWDGTTGKVRRLLREGGAIAQIGRSEWLPESRLLLATVRRPPTPAATGVRAAPAQEWLLRIDAGSGRTEAIAAFARRSSLAVSTTRPAALALVAGDRVALIQAERPVLDVTEKILRAAGDGAGINWLTAAPGGQLRVAVSIRRDGKSQSGMVEVELPNGTARLWPSGAQAQEPSDAPAVDQTPLFSLAVASGKLVSPAGERPISNVLLISGEESPRATAVLAVNADVGEISPAGDIVAYVNSEGACYIRRIHKLDRAALVAVRRNAVQAELMNRGKQFGIALAMYSQDYDEMLPPAGSFNLVAPYLRSRDVSDFIYTSNGGPLSGIEKPGKTEAGYMVGPGGKIVVYIDGHVEWVPDS